MMSPGWTALSGTFGRLASCAAAECGSDTPACAHAHIVRPEQSKEDGPAAPKTYGAPITERAAAAAISPLPDAAGGLKSVPPPVSGGGVGWVVVVGVFWAAAAAAAAAAWASACCCA